MNSFEYEEPINQLASPFGELPKLTLNGIPVDVEDTIYYRSGDGKVCRIKWRGMGIGNTYFFAENGRYAHSLPPYEGYYTFDKAECVFRSIGVRWEEAAKNLVAKNKAAYTAIDNRKAIADAIDAKLKELKPKIKRTSNTQLGATAEILKDMRDSRA